MVRGAGSGSGGVPSIALTTEGVPPGEWINLPPATAGETPALPGRRRK